MRMMATATASTAGMVKLRLMLSHEVLRQASSGPTAVSSSKKSVIGVITRLKNGGPTVILVPCTHSLRTGKSVPQSTAKQAARRTRLLKRKLDSRETRASSLFSLFRCWRLRTKKNMQVAKHSARKVENQGPME